MKNKYNISVLLFSIYTVLTLTYVAYCKIISSTVSINTLLRNTSMYSLILVVICVIIWKYVTGKTFSLFIFYFLSYYLFTMGQSILYLFEFQHSFANVYLLISPITMLETHLFTMLCINFLFFGGLLSLYRKKQSFKDKSNPIDYTKSMKNVGQLLFIVSIIPMLVQLYMLLTSYGIGGYAYAFKSVSNARGINKIISLLYPLFPSSLVMLYLSSGSKEGKIYQTIMVIVGMAYFFIGERTGAASILLIAILMSSNINNKNYAFKKKNNKFAIFLLVFILAVTIPALGKLRNSSNIRIRAIIEVIMMDGIFSVITDTIATMGFSMFPLAKTIEIIPSIKKYAYGQSYLFAFLSLFPNIFGGTHISVKYSGLAQWLMDTLNMNYGPGFSYPAEAWYNFGWVGFLIMTLIGYLFCRILHFPKGEDYSPTKAFIGYTFFLQVITSPRRELMTVIRLCGYYVFIPLVLVYLLKSINKRSKIYESKI